MNKSILARLEALEEQTKRNLYGIVTFDDGGKTELSLLKIIKIWRSAPEDICGIEWLSSDADNGKMPDILEYMINRQNR